MFIQEFLDSRERAAEVVADTIAHHLETAIAQRGNATLVVSGGSSPLASYRLLRTRPLDWSRVTIVPSDERWVGEDDPASNEGMLRRELVTGAAASARLLGLYDGSVADAEAAMRIGERIDRLPRPFDYVLLGMGADGHTASLFPDDPGIAKALSSTASCVMARPPSQPLQRISLTPQALLDARALGLLFFGEDKAEVFAEGIGGRRPRDVPGACSVAPGTRAGDHLLCPLDRRAACILY